ncbi:MAG: hypothetical protein EBT04_00815 [Betaproteobacteria bacterium]|nr:hypothetical protein [Betaproteobacteria bacterium]
MITRNPNSLVRVASLCVSALLIIDGTGCAWRRSNPAAANGSTSSPGAAPLSASVTAPAPVSQGGAPVPPARGPNNAPLSGPPIPRNSDSTPSSTPTGTPSSQVLIPAETAAAPTPVTALPPPKIDHRKHAGNYHCDHGRSMRIEAVADQPDVILLTWQGTQHRLERVHSNSGAERFEELSTGLVWILIPGKAMLLSTSQGRALANECHL